MSAPTARRCHQCDLTYSHMESFCPLCGAQLVDPSKGSSDPLCGKIIAERYVLERRLGAGGMGAVYLARHRMLERRYAIKFLHLNLLKDPRSLLRFLREARATSALDHPSAVRLYDYGATEGREPYLVMEYLEGESLFDHLHSATGRRLPTAQAVDIALGLVRVLDHAHGKQIVHRDIKLENVLLTYRQGITDWPVLLDFGIARIIDLPPLTRYGDELIGTPQYLSPESITAIPGPPADLYAMGILLHEMLTGTPPFEGELHQILFHHQNTVPPLVSERGATQVPPELDQLIARLLEKPTDRRPTAAQAADELQAIRTLLPPRSLSGLLAAQTLILNHGPAAAAATVVLPSALAATVISPGSEGRGPSLGERSTVLLPAFLRQIDGVEDTLQRIGSSLSRRLRGLGDRVWGAAWPADAASLRRRIEEAEGRQEILGMDLALLDRKVEEEEAVLHGRREACRRQLIDFSERLQFGELLSDAERDTLRRAIESSEAALTELERAAPGALQTQRDALRRDCQRLRAECHGLQAQLAGRLLGIPWPRSLQQDRQRLEEDLNLFESALGMEALLLRRLPS